jgi:hypothetical protein
VVEHLDGPNPEQGIDPMLRATHDYTTPRHPANALAAAVFASPNAIPLNLKCCPFCQSDPDVTTRFAGRVAIFCNNDDCTVAPQTMAPTLLEAAKRWNDRGAR